MIVVSNRGPFRFARNPDGTFSAHRGVRRSRQRAHAAAGQPGGRNLGRGRDQRGRPGGGAGRVLRLRPAACTPSCSCSIPRISRLHYDVISNGVLWFLHHGLFDLARRPRFDRRFREAWEGYVSVNRSFTDAVIDVAPDGETVLVQDYQLTLVPQMLAHARPDLHVVHFTHTPFCGPSSVRVLPEYVAHAICSSMAAAPPGSTPNDGHERSDRRREVLGSDAAIGRTFAASFGPIPRCSRPRSRHPKSKRRSPRSRSASATGS